MNAILVVDDEVRSLETISRILDDEFTVFTATSAKQALEVLANQDVHVVLSDQRMPEVSGVELLSQVRELYPNILRVIISGYTDSENIINAINQAGIYQYITKPWHPEQLLMVLHNAKALYQLQQQNQLLHNELNLTQDSFKAKITQGFSQLKQDFNFSNVIRAESSPMNKVIERVNDVAKFDISVMITGESGTGKELLARAIHYNSQRAEKPFILENCGAMHDELLSSELFGHKKGAFTGAINDHIGLFEKANGGTIFLDEIGDISPAFQVKLLRVLQEGEIRPLGSNQSKKVDVRVIAATNRDLKQAVANKQFRADLYYRLTTVNLHIPPLRKRPMDILPIAHHLLGNYSQSLAQPLVELDAQTREYLVNYPWPGNIRELQNEIQRLIVFSHGKHIIKETLSEDIQENYHQQHDNLTQISSHMSLKERVEVLEQALIKEALDIHQGNKSKVAEELGLSRVGLANKLSRYNIDTIQEN